MIRGSHVASSHSARRSYRWWRHATFATAITGPSFGRLCVVKTPLDHEQRCTHVAQCVSLARLKLPRWSKKEGEESALLDDQRQPSSVAPATLASLPMRSKISIRLRSASARPIRLNCRSSITGLQVAYLSLWGFSFVFAFALQCHSLRTKPRP